MCACLFVLASCVPAARLFTSREDALVHVLLRERRERLRDGREGEMRERGRKG